MSVNMSGHLWPQGSVARKPASEAAMDEFRNVQSSCLPGVRCKHSLAHVMDESVCKLQKFLVRKSENKIMDNSKVAKWEN